MKILTLRGVDLKVHISLLILAAYLVLIISLRLPLASQAAGIDPAALDLGPLAWGLILAVSLFASVVFHEFGHVLMAQKLGMKVRGVTLMMLGGISEMEQVPEQKYAEFKLAIVGPLVSFALAAGFLTLRSFAQEADAAFFCHWLGTTNLILGIFNLLPAFPLDGGRALRSILAAKQGMQRATRNAVRVSQVFAWIFGLFALLSFNIILMLIAFFVWTSAQSELYLLNSKKLLRGLKVREIAIRAEPALESDPVSLAAERMIQSKSMALPVRTATGPSAIIRLERIQRIPKNVWTSTRTRELMETPHRPLRSDESVGECLGELISGPGATLPVEEDGQTIGIARYADLTEILQFRSLTQESGQEPVESTPESAEDENRVA